MKESRLVAYLRHDTDYCPKNGSESTPPAQHTPPIVRNCQGNESCRFRICLYSQEPGLARRQLTDYHGC